jgi:hypothetical protein
LEAVQVQIAELRNSDAITAAEYDKHNTLPLAKLFKDAAR